MALLRINLIHFLTLFTKNKKAIETSIDQQFTEREFLRC